MNLTITMADNDVVLAIEVSEEMTVADLRAYALEEAGLKPNTSSIVFFNNKPLKDTSKLQEVGLANDDIVLLTSPDPESEIVAEAPNSMTTFASQGAVNGATSGLRSNGNINSASGGDVNDDAPISMQIEAARRQILYDPQLLLQLSQQSPELADALHDPEQFKRAYLVLQQQQLKNKAENDEIDRNFRLAMEEMPEAFTTVTMLFANIEVNGIPVKAFIDSGAQTTIMSPECAERCQLSHLIDKRHRGMAYGVGQATILGRIHMAPIKIGASYFACSMTVIEGTNMEFLLGLDMLKHHQATLDLRRNRLLMGHEELPFLSESEIPKNLVGPPGSAGTALVSKPSTGLPRGALNNLQGLVSGKKDAGPSVAGDDSAQTSPTGPSGTSSTSLRQQSQPSRNRSDQSSEASQEYDAATVNNLMNLGFNKQEVLRALRMAGGNADIAAANLFGG